LGSKETTPAGPLCIKSIFQAEIAEVINPLHIKEAKNIIASKIYEQTNKPPTFVQQNQEMSKAPIQYDPATGKILHYFHHCRHHDRVGTNILNLFTITVSWSAYRSMIRSI